MRCSACTVLSQSSKSQCKSQALQIDTQHLHGGIHSHLPHQLLLALDPVLEAAAASETVHIRYAPPLLTPSVAPTELADVLIDLFGTSMCAAMSIQPASGATSEKETTGQIQQQDRSEDGAERESLRSEYDGSASKGSQNHATQKGIDEQPFQLDSKTIHRKSPHKEQPATSLDDNLDDAMPSDRHWSRPSIRAGPKSVSERASQQVIGSSKGSDGVKFSDDGKGTNGDGSGSPASVHDESNSRGGGGSDGYIGGGREEDRDFKSAADEDSGSTMRRGDVEIASHDKNHSAYSDVDHRNGSRAPANDTRPPSALSAPRQSMQPGAQSSSPEGGDSEVMERSSAGEDVARPRHGRASMPQPAADESKLTLQLVAGILKGGTDKGPAANDEAALNEPASDSSAADMNDTTTSSGQESRPHPQAEVLGPLRNESSIGNLVPEDSATLSLGDDSTVGLGSSDTDNVQLLLPGASHLHEKLR
jgi:hypothetical protein